MVDEYPYNQQRRDSEGEPVRVPVSRKHIERRDARRKVRNG